MFIIHEINSNWVLFISCVQWEIFHFGGIIQVTQWNIFSVYIHYEAGSAHTSCFAVVDMLAENREFWTACEAYAGKHLALFSRGITK